MDIFFITLNQLITLFLLIGLGYFLRKRNFITDVSQKSLSSLLLQVALPAFVIISLQMPYSHETLINGSIFFCIGAFIHILGFLFGVSAFKLFKGRSSDDAVWFCGTMLPNLSFMGIPIIKAILGDEPLFYVSISTIVFNLFAFTLGTYLYARKNQADINYKKLLISPTNCSFIAALIFFLFGVKLPSPIYVTLSSLTGLITPISMLVIGGMISQVRLGELFNDRDVYIISITRLIIAPIVFMLIMKMLPIDEMMLKTSVILMAMPCATITALLAAQNENSESFASRVVFISTFLCIITLPIFAMLIV